MCNDISIEFCNGLHVKKVGDIGLFKIISCKSVSYRVNRIEIISYLKAYRLFQNNFNYLFV